MGQEKLNAWKRRLLYTTRDDRSNLLLVANNIILHLHPSTVPVKALRFTYTWGLGGASAVLFLLLVLSGLLLVFRYDARVDYAYISIQQIESQVAFGSLVRGVHHWSANLLVFTVFLHLLRVFFTGGYKEGRTANWLIGVALFVLVLAANFTGYLLPWDQLAYWAITVSTSLLAYIPLVGIPLRNLILGAPVVGQNALSNFYAIHVVFIPLLMTAMVVYHFWKVRKNGGLSQPKAKPGERSERVTTLPHLVEREAAVALIVVAGVLVFAMLRPSPLGDLADPFESPNPAKAAWYFLGLQELLLHMTPLAAIALVCLALAFLVLIPYWDRSSEDIGVYFRSRLGRLVALVGFFLAILFVPLLVVADEYLINFQAWFPSLPDGVSGGLIPLVLTLAGLSGVYALLRWGVRPQGSRPNHSEALLGLFTFIFTSLVILTIIGVFFRGENITLVVPFL